MSPLNRGPMLGPNHGPRIPPAAMRMPMPRYGRGPPPLPGMVHVPPPPPGMFGPPRGRPIPPPIPNRVGPMMRRQAPVPPIPMFGVVMRGRRVPPMPLIPPMPMRGPMGMHGPMMRPGPRGVLPPHALPHMRPRFPVNNKAKTNSPKKNNKMEDIELKKPWMTDEIRCEIQKKNKLYAKAKKNKDAKEWEEFKDLRNKVTRMIRDAKNEYLSKHPEQAHLYENETIFEYDEKEDEDDYENDDSEEETLYCEMCDREFDSQAMLDNHVKEHRTCKIDGCTFTAHPKIVEKHIAMQHATGLYERMKRTMNDDEKYIAERKKRYPTVEKTNLKEAEHLEKEKRGEVVKDHNNEKTRHDSKKDPIRKNRKRKRNRQTRKPVSEKQPVKLETYRGIMPFTGTANLDEKLDKSDNELSKEETVIENKVVLGNEAVVDNKCVKDDENVINNVKDANDVDDIEISDEEEIIVQPIVQENLKPEVAAPKMFGLVADYGSDSDDDEPPDEVPVKKLKTQEENEVPETSEPPKKIVEETIIVTEKIKNNNDKNDKSAFRSDKKLKNNEKRRTVDNKRQFNKSREQNNARYSDDRLRLLNKLLARSIQHERNAIFQCITFIAKNNFLD